MRLEPSSKSQSAATDQPGVTALICGLSVASSWAPSDRIEYSSRGLPTSWIPIGSPAFEVASGTLIAGCPVQLNGWVKLSQSRNSLDAVLTSWPRAPILGAG